MTRTAEEELLAPIADEIEATKTRTIELEKEIERQTHRLTCLRSARDSIEQIDTFGKGGPDEITVEPESPNSVAFDPEALKEWAEEPPPQEEIPNADPTPKPVPIDNDEAEKDLSIDTLSYVAGHYPESVATATVADHLDIDPADARALLKGLAEDGKLIREGGGRYTRWIVAGSDTQDPIEPPPVTDSPVKPAPEKVQGDRPETRDDWARIEDQIVRTLKASTKPQAATQLAGTLDYDISIVTTALAALKGQARIHLVRTDNGDKYEPVR